MTKEELAKLPPEERARLIEEEIGRRTPAPTGGGAAQAFEGGTVPVEEVKKPPNPLLAEDSFKKDLAIGGTTLAAEELTRRYVSPTLAKGGLPGKVAAVAAPLVASGAAGAATELAAGLTSGRDDSFAEAAKHAVPTGVEQFMGAVTGEMGSRLMNKLPLDPRIAPEWQSAVNTINDRVREVYEKTVDGKLIAQRKQWWNPMRKGYRLETMLDSTEQAARLRAAGYDPAMARQIAEQGVAGAGDLADNTLYKWAQNVAGSMVLNAGEFETWKGTRAAMLQDAIHDLGAQYGKTIDPAYWGKAVHAALNGELKAGSMIREPVVRTIDELQSMKTGGSTGSVVMPWGLGTAKLKNNLDPASPPDGLVGKMSEYANWKEVASTRTALGSLAMDEGLDQAQRWRAAELAKTLDDATLKRLPPDARKLYKQFQNVDNDMSAGQLNTGFIRGLISSFDKQGAKKYALDLLKRGDVLDYKRLNAALGPGSTEMQNLKAATVDVITENATSVNKSGVPTLNPAAMRAQLNQHKGLGTEYLETMFGKQFVKDYTSYADALDRFNETGRSTKAGGVALSMTQYGSVMAPAAGVVAKLFHAGISPTDVAWMTAVGTVPQYVARAMLKPKSSLLLRAMMNSGDSPHRFTRLATRLAESIGKSPEQILEDIGFGISPLEKWKRQVQEGKGLIPQSLGAGAQAALDPAGAMAKLGNPDALNEALTGQ